MHKIGVVQLPGSNCERETKLALQRVGLKPVDILWFMDPRELVACAGYVIVGGFAYEDRNRAGSIAAFDPMIQALIPEAMAGKPIIGICNGAQVLVETGLVPGYVDASGKLLPAIALTANRRELAGTIQGIGYYNTQCRIKQAAMDHQSIVIPLAHGEGRFVMAGEVYQDLLAENVTRWQYVDEAGQVVDSFPCNPNGSQHNLAAVGNFSGNVLAMMPHPERCPDGDAIFLQLKQYLNEKKLFAWKTKSAASKDLGAGEQGLEVASLALYDKTYFVRGACNNEAVSVALALRQQGINVELTQYIFWGLTFQQPVNVEKALIELEQSYALWNPQKETITEALPAAKPLTYCLVTDNFSPQALYKLQALQQRYLSVSLASLTRGIVWGLAGESHAVNSAMKSHLLAHPVSQRLQQLNEWSGHSRAGGNLFSCQDDTSPGVTREHK